MIGSTVLKAFRSLFEGIYSKNVWLPCPHHYFRKANRMQHLLDARITRVAPDVRSAFHSMGYFWSVLYM
jgi:hypothetical protein